MLDSLERLTALWRDGALTDDEFSAAKAKLLSGTASALSPSAAAGPVDMPREEQDAISEPAPAAGEIAPETAAVPEAQPAVETPDVASPKKRSMKTLLMVGGGAILLAGAGVGLGIATRSFSAGEEAHEDAGKNHSEEKASEEGAAENEAEPPAAADEPHDRPAPANAAEEADPEVIVDDEKFGEPALYAATCPSVSGMTGLYAEKLSNKFSASIDSFSVVPHSATMMSYGSFDLKKCVVKIDTPSGRKLCQVGHIVRQADGKVLTHIGGIATGPKTAYWNASVVCEGDSHFR